MPANLPAEYFKLEREYWKASSKREKIKILQQMIAVIPKHKGSEHLIGDLKRRISKLKEELRKEEKRRKSLARRVGIKKEGAAQVCLVGYPNTGKSYLMNKLCNTKLDSTEIPFETAEPAVGTMFYKGIKIQLVEIPSVYEGFYEKKRIYVGIIRNADLVAIVGDPSAEKEIGEVKKKIYIKSTDDLNEIKEKIWKALDLMIVYTKEPGKKIKEPVAMKKNSTVKDLGEEIHKDFVKKFKYAKIIKENGMIKRVGLNYVLEEGDAVEFHLR